MTGAVEKELYTYIERLNKAEKKSVLTFIKNVLSAKDEETITIEQYNKELDDADAEMDKGIFHTNEEVFARSKQIIDARKKS